MGILVSGMEGVRIPRLAVRIALVRLIPALVILRVQHLREQSVHVRGLFMGKRVKKRIPLVLGQKEIPL